MLNEPEIKLIQNRAYFLSRHNPGNTEQDNWVQAEAEIKESLRATKRLKQGLCTFLSSLLLFLVAFGMAAIVAAMREVLLKQEFYKDNPILINIAFYGLISFLVFLFIQISLSWQCARHVWLRATRDIRRIGAGKDLWAWIELMGAPSVFAIAAGFGSYFFSQSSQDIAKVLASQKEQEVIMQSYLLSMSSVVARKRWIRLNQDERIAISTRTLNTLEALEGYDGTKQAIVFRFATRVFPDFACLKSNYDENEAVSPVHQIRKEGDIKCAWPKNVSLAKIQLEGLRIDETNSIYRGTLKEADLSKANLVSSNFTLADLDRANLTGAKLNNTFFSAATILRAVDLTNADLEGAQFDGTNLANLKRVMKDGKQVPSIMLAKFEKIKFTRNLQYIIKQLWMNDGPPLPLEETVNNGDPKKPMQNPKTAQQSPKMISYLCPWITEGKIVFVPERNDKLLPNTDPYTKTNAMRDTMEKSNELKEIKKMDVDEYKNYFDTRFERIYGCKPKDS